MRLFIEGVFISLSLMAIYSAMNLAECFYFATAWFMAESKALTEDTIMSVCFPAPQTIFPFTEMLTYETASEVE